MDTNACFRNWLQDDPCQPRVWTVQDYTEALARGMAPATCYFEGETWKVTELATTAATLWRMSDGQERVWRVSRRLLRNGGAS